MFYAFNWFSVHGNLTLLSNIVKEPMLVQSDVCLHYRNTSLMSVNWPRHKETLQFVVKASQTLQGFFLSRSKRVNQHINSQDGKIISTFVPLRKLPAVAARWWISCETSSSRIGVNQAQVWQLIQQVKHSAVLLFQRWTSTQRWLWSGRAGKWSKLGWVMVTLKLPHLCGLFMRTCSNTKSLLQWKN